MHGTGREFGESLHAVCGALDMELAEISDWNCCGASATHTVDHSVGYGLSLRNIKLAEQGGADIVTPCAACFANLKHAEHEARERGEYSGPAVRNLLEAMATDAGMDEIKSKVTQPLAGLKPAAYYGCLMVRPPEIMQMDDAEDPVLLDNVMAALGIKTVKWSYKTDCCGASLSVPRTDVVLKLAGKLLIAAVDAGANCIVSACPMCQLNLDTRQAEAAQALGKSFNLPVYYFTELMGVAFGLPGYQTWFNRHLVNPLPLVREAMTAPTEPVASSK